MGKGVEKEQVRVTGKEARGMGGKMMAEGLG
jgi:hypothetical protein